MREEGISSSGDPLLFPNSPPPTAAASSAGASSPVVAINAGSTDWLGPGQGSKAGSMSRISSQPVWISLSTSAGGSALGSSKRSCRPWERGDLLRRLSTFSPANWFGKPKAASSLSCARRGWVNIDVDKIQCESCGKNLKYNAQDSWACKEGDSGEEFASQLDEGHNATCPWRGNNCAESLVQFPPTPPSALIGGYKDRCDGLIQFPYLPVVASSALDQMKLSRALEIDRFLVQLSAYPAEVTSDSEISIYLRAQKLISLCGWEPRWLPNVQDCEEHSAQSAKNGGSFSPIRDHDPLQDRGAEKKLFSSLTKKKGSRVRSRFESGTPLLDCSLCGASVRILDFVRVDLPPRFAPPNNIDDVPETSRKMAITRGVSAASAISGWVAADGTEEEQTEDIDEAAMSNVRMDLNLTMGSGFSTGHGSKRPLSELYQDGNLGRDLVIGQPAGSEVGDRAASYESRGPSTFKRNVDEGGSTVDRPHGLLIRQADSVEGVVIDRDGDEIYDSKMSQGGPSKRRPCESSSGAGPSRTLYFDIGQAGPHSSQGHEQQMAHASSVIAMDTVCHSDDNDSMESVENHPGFIDEVNYPSTSAVNPDIDETSDMNHSIQPQQSTCPPTVWVTSEIGVSSTNDEEVLNVETATVYRPDGPSLAVSGGSVGMGASHEAEIHGLIHRTESVVGDMEPVTGVTENQGQTGEFVPEEMQQEYSGRGDNGSKIVGSVKGESAESGEKTSDLNLLPHEQNSHPSLSCNAVVYSGLEVSKDEVMQARKSSPDEECGYPSYTPPANDLGPPNVESKFEEPVEFDPIKHHNFFCPWVNGNVAAAGVINSNGDASSSSTALALCGWQLTLDALNGFQGAEQNQTVESESAASLYKDDHRGSGKKLMARHSFNKSRGQN